MARKNSGKGQQKTRVTLETGGDDVGDIDASGGDEGNRGGEGEGDQGDASVMRGSPSGGRGSRRRAADDSDINDQGGNEGDADDTEIEIGGQTLKVDKKTALLVTAIQASTQAQLDGMRKLLKPEKAPPELGQDGEADKTQDFAQKFALEFYSDPAKAAHMLEEHIMKRARAEYTQATGIEKFWNDFYDVHEDLDRKTDHWVVKAVAQEKWNEVADLPADEAMEKLGNAIRGRLLTLQKKQKQQRDANGRGTLDLETGGTTHRPLRSASNGRDKQNSLSNVINKRRLERQNSSLRQLVQRDRQGQGADEE